MVGIDTDDDQAAAFHRLVVLQKEPYDNCMTILVALMKLTCFACCLFACSCKCATWRENECIRGDWLSLLITNARHITLYLPYERQLDSLPS